MNRRSGARLEDALARVRGRTSCPYDAGVTARRTLGVGPEAAHGIRAPQADLLASLPSVRLPDLDELRARGVLGNHPAVSPVPRRTLGAGGRADEGTASRLSS
ncbi:hypothetical protein GCM10010339_93500 [Streptomyces alanosinicus]|uniref:Uncharacterized protein n=1 Tax=Streptomyces alanosinicus TaxID=68171 RepID=A0A918MH37_9ACTN|nr:hypothetical protein GCM10010339_93500 [Streptomyces alanosinicus]